MDTTWSVRIPEELKEKLSLLISESGQNAKDFINQLVQLYALKETARLEPHVSVDIEELSQITGRINNIFINLFERTSSFQKQREDEFSTRLAEKDEMLAVFNGKIKELEDNLVVYENKTIELKKQYEEIRSQHDRLTDVCEANKALVLEYKEKNDTLSGLLAEYKEFKDALLVARVAVDEEKNLRLSTESRLLNSEMELTALRKTMEEERTAFEVKLQREIERHELLNERHILEIKKDYQQKLQSEQDVYLSKVRELLCVIEEMQRAKPGKKTVGVKSIQSIPGNS